MKMTEVCTIIREQFMRDILLENLFEKQREEFHFLKRISVME